MTTLRYQPYYCEENVWQWLEHSAPTAGHALFITNAQQQVALWQQRLAPPNDAVLWDYHVVAITRPAMDWLVWDRDSRLPLPCPLAAYLQATFRPLTVAEHQLAPQFRRVPAAAFCGTFASDRRHMRDPDGTWLQPPPPWSPIGQGHNLDRYLDLQDGIAGAVLDLPTLLQWAEGEHRPQAG